MDPLIQDACSFGLPENVDLPLKPPGGVRMLFHPPRVGAEELALNLSALAISPGQHGSCAGGAPELSQLLGGGAVHSSACLGAADRPPAPHCCLTALAPEFQPPAGSAAHEHLRR